MKDKNQVEIVVGARAKVNQAGASSSSGVYRPSCCAVGVVRSVNHMGCYVDFDPTNYPSYAYVPDGQRALYGPNEDIEILQ